MKMNRLVAQVAVHEGLRLKPYRCTEGYLTIGYGRNLETRGITQDEAVQMLRRDLEEAIEAARGMAGDRLWRKLGDRRREVLVEMVYQLGVSGVGKFKRMWKALRKQDWSEASDEMIDSRWAVQTPNRAAKLAIQMEEGS